jgi:hypothetical protein
MTIVLSRQFHIPYVIIMSTLTYIRVNNVIKKKAMNLKIMHNILNLDTEVVICIVGLAICC